MDRAPFLKSAFWGLLVKTIRPSTSNTLHTACPRRRSFGDQLTNAVNALSRIEKSSRATNAPRMSDLDMAGVNPASTM